MDFKMLYDSEVSQRNTNMWYRGNLKNMMQMDLFIFTKQKQSHSLRAQLWMPGGKWWTGTDWECGINMYTLLDLKQIKKKLLKKLYGS